MPVRRPHLLIVNASLAGDTGNTAPLLEEAARLLRRRAMVETLTLKDAWDGFQTPTKNPHPSLKTEDRRPLTKHAAPLPDSVCESLQRADGFLFGTGTHWDSWSSVLQHFLEAATPHEGTALWLGKPAAVVVTEHSVGGKGVLSRLQGVLVTLGCSIPPMSGLVLSRAALLAAKHEPRAAQDFWSNHDLNIITHNLAEAARISVGGARPKWRAWEVDRHDFHARWLE